MKKSGIILLIFVLTISAAQAQRKASRHSPKKVKRTHTFFVEGGGNGIYGSVNYDKAFNFSRFAASFRVGVGLLPSSNSASNYIYPVIPLEGNILIGKKNHFLEIGLGVSSLIVYRSISQPSPKYIFMGFARIGYRMQKDNGMFLRIGFTPIFGDFAVNEKVYNERGLGLVPWGGIAIGDSF